MSSNAAFEECAEVIMSLCTLASHMPIKHPQQGAGRDDLVERARRVAARICALSPDPIRAALEECVRAMEPLIRYAVLNDIHERPDGALEIPNAALMNLRVAYRNARALQGE